LACYHRATLNPHPVSRVYNTAPPFGGAAGGANPRRRMDRSLFMNLTRLLFTAAVGLGLLGATASADPASVAVANVQKFYADIQHVDSLFRQEVTNNTFGTTKSSDGEVWIAKPGKMRWDYREKRKDVTVVKKSFISNGSTLYVVEHDNKQVVKKNLQQDLMPVAVTFLYGKGDLKGEFNAVLDTASSYGGKGDYVLKLTPKKPSAQYKTLYLVADPTQFRVKESVIIDASNNVNHFQFYAPDFQKPIDSKKTFEFDDKSVPNYRIVDGDAPQKAPDGAAPAPAPAPKK
jgi:outer membrane lipoprotein-sorting protein